MNGDAHARFWSRLWASAAIFGALAAPAHPDSLASHWNEARERWNPIGDAAADGDASALAELKETVSNCLLDAACAPANQDAPATVGDPTWGQVHAATAAANLGWLYGDDKMGAEDDVQASHYYRFAAAIGHPPAMQAMGTRLRSGNGVPVDAGKALAYLEAAYRAGSVSGALNYADMIKEDDPVAAFEILSRAIRMAPTREQMDRINELHAEIAPAARAAMSGVNTADSAPPRPQPQPQPQPAEEVEADLTREETRECAQLSVELRRRIQTMEDREEELQDWNRELEQRLRRLNDQYADAVTDGQYAAAQRNEDRYLSENDEFNSAAEAYNRDRAQLDRENDAFDEACTDKLVIVSWAKAACETYSYSSTWCGQYSDP